MARSPGASLGSFWNRILNGSEIPARRRSLMAATLGLVLVIGIADYLTGFEVSLLVFYFIPISLAVIASGWRFGVLTAIASIAIWLAGDIAAGAHYPRPIVPIWNALIALTTYIMVIWLLGKIMALHREMEQRVRQRTAALTEEIAERERLEKAVIEIGERERWAIGRDLHDGLGQHLTGTALVAQALAVKLAGREAAEAQEMRKVVSLLEQGIEQTRNVARHLLLSEIDRGGLASALEELAAAVRAQHRIACEFRMVGETAFDKSDAGTHLYRIAQEAVRNAVRHGRARHIEVTLSAGPGEVILQVSDNGSGLPLPGVRREGLGLRIMAHRAAIIGGRFKVEARPQGGTVVECRLPNYEYRP